MHPFLEVGLWLRWLCIIIHRALFHIETIVGNWGLALILLALLMRLVLLPLTRRAEKSNDRYKKAYRLIEPELKSIKKNYSGGEQSERILELFKKNGISPLQGLKPLMMLFLQVPILLALYQVLLLAPELQPAKFIWIDSLAMPDRLIELNSALPLIGTYINVLPLLMTVISLVSLYISNKDNLRSNETYSMLFMSFSFLIIFYNFPSGMVLYWTFASFFQILERRIF